MQPLQSDHPNRTANKGYIAHIIGSSEDGPRGNAELSKALAKDPDNVMLLCDGCHRVIDRDESDKHPVEVLRRKKAEHEDWISRSVGLRPASQSHILRFTNQIAANETAIPVDMCIAAMQAIGRTPASFDPIDLKLGIGGQQDDGDLFWAVEPDDLVRFFQERMKGRINSGQYRHISVFGLATPVRRIVLMSRPGSAPLQPRWLPTSPKLAPSLPASSTMTGAVSSSPSLRAQ